MTARYGFELVQEQEIAEVGGNAQVWQHTKTGARVLSVLNDDENKVFGIAFRTPPEDSTGVPHILEHSVLCGSEKYPLKEPFVELLKGSLQTFLNAFTFPDKTCYPVASANTQDFYNLIDVYLDAVFAPTLTEDTLKQEGWHYHLNEAGDDIEYKGVVFNEMKGVYSSPDSRMYELCQNSLFPDNTYGNDSGGNPVNIPDLTFEAYMDFYHTHYHPSNSYTLFYGDDEPEKRLEILDAYFSRYEAIEVEKTQVPLQKPFGDPITMERGYVVSDDDSGDNADEKSSMCAVNFCLPEAADAMARLEMEVLEHILIGLPSSPLRKALIDSGLGEDLCGAGLETDLRQMFFSAGLKGIKKEDAEKVEALILETLEELTEEGFSQEDIEAALNTVEFDLRENNTGSYPRGIMLYILALSSWLYDGDALELLPYEAHLSELRSRLDNGEKLFEELVEKHLLENTHRSTVILYPDAKMGAEIEAAEKAILTKVKESLSAEEIDNLVKETAALEEMQGAHDSPEALATIPRLTPEDLPKEGQELPTQESTVAGIPVLSHDLDTRGIFYFDMVFDTSAVPDNLIPYLRIFGRTLLELGTDKSDEATLTRRIASKTGGIDTRNLFQTHTDGSLVTKFMVEGKSTVEKATELGNILAEVLTGTAFDNHERLSQIILESKARLEHSLVPSGHMSALTRVGAKFSPIYAMRERTEGVEALFFLRELALRMETEPEAVSADLRALRDIILVKNDLLLNVTLQDQHTQTITPALEAVTNALPEKASEAVSRSVMDTPEKEGLALPAQVNYVAKGTNVKALGYEYQGGAQVAIKYLRTAYLWDRVRVQGGAYGAFPVYDKMSGTLCMVSYRDPNLDRTLKEYDGAGEFLKGYEIPIEELRSSIVGTIGEIDRYMLPDAKGHAALVRHLVGETPADRQKVREEILGCTPDSFRQFSQALELFRDNGKVAVLGGKDGLTEAETKLEVTDVL
ncbi:MAG: insulinase family protein [Desulfovibrio sp.]